MNQMLDRAVYKWLGADSIPPDDQTHLNLLAEKTKQVKETAARLLREAEARTGIAHTVSVEHDPTGHTLTVKVTPWQSANEETLGR